MTDPELIVHQLKQLRSSISNGYYQMGFVLQAGYEMWLEDVYEEAHELLLLCERKLYLEEKE